MLIFVWQIPVTLEWMDSQSISVAGSFSNWEPIPLARRLASLSLPPSDGHATHSLPVCSPSTGVYQGAIDLPSEGVFQYKFVVDGKWTYNPNQVIMSVNEGVSMD